MVISNKVLCTFIYNPNLSRNYLLLFVWYTNIFYASDPNLFTVLVNFHVEI
jgi:hypothetical protein